VTTVPEAIEGNMGPVHLWKTLAEGSSEPDTHIVESQNYPLHICDDAREGFLANFLFNLPVVAIPHASTPMPGQIVPVCMRRFQLLVAMEFDVAHRDRIKNHLFDGIGLSEDAHDQKSDAAR
jgi:hypothetical protein